MAELRNARQGKTFRFAITYFGILVTCGLVATRDIHADVKLPSVLNSHMVLQRDMPIPVWGWADAGETVTVTIGESSAKATADADGKWKVSLPAMKADGKAHSLTVVGNNTVTLEDILIGEVWVGSGQSNMEWQLRSTNSADEAIAAAKHPNIRLFHVKKVQKPEPADDVEVTAHWTACTPESVPAFSGVLYYFGRKVHEEIDVPVGLINSSWGGSPIEPWTVTDKGSGGMYNGMIAPLQPFGIRGAIWYQGETNVIGKNGLAYFDKTKDLVEGWRKTWNSELPFYFVQIAPWSGARYEPGQLPALWEAQTASLKIPRTGMAVTTDLVDNIADIHPRNKLDVGNRLARWALAKTYGMKDVVYSGPLFRSIKVEGTSVRVEFAHTAGGLKSRDDAALSEFQIAGADGKFVDAEAKIDGKSVVVSSAEVAEPKNVRFGWHKLANPNLVNSEGLPASPFQKENWQGGVGE
jgi:sialate O-acetylesterase